MLYMEKQWILSREKRSKLKNQDSYKGVCIMCMMILANEFACDFIALVTIYNAIVSPRYTCSHGSICCHLLASEKAQTVCKQQANEASTVDYVF